MAPEHLTDSQISGYLDRDLSAPERSSVEAHLDDCRSCREAVADVSRMSHSYAREIDATAGASRQPVTRRRAAAPAFGLIAAGIGVVWILSRDAPGAPDRTSATRSQNGTEIAQIAVVAPANEELAADRRLVWRSLSADLYRLAILDDSGEPVYQADVTDTSLVIPDSAHLEPGRLYFWRLDAIIEGVAVTSGARKLRLTR